MCGVASINVTGAHRDVGSIPHQTPCSVLWYGHREDQPLNTSDNVRPLFSATFELGPCVTPARDRETYGAKERGETATY